MEFHQNEFDIRKRYCPSVKKNVIVKIYYGECAGEICTEHHLCEANGGCTNRYLQPEDRSSHSL